jgi:formylglycine-generating enzyme required for sulfatase activity
MVYNQVGGFQAGSGAINNGEFRRANDVTSSGTASTFTITGSLPTVQGNSSSSSPNNLAAYNNTYTDLSGTATASLASGFPTGFEAFYSMKYEISQQQYVDFLNTLTYTQQAARTTSPPSSAAGTGALINPNDKRNGIDIQTPGTATTVPAVYACNLDDDGTFNEADDGQHIACNYLSWDDLTAYLDWAGLRPMTELEFEKSCRGNQSPVSGVYPWGTTSATALTGLTNPGLTNELASNAGANIAFNNSFNSGPVRTGIFASAFTDRSSSGAGYYGSMELSGNLWERCVTIGNATGRSFSAANGNGNISSTGTADVSGWIGVNGSGYKGGSWQTNIGNSATVSDRLYAAFVDNTRYEDAGGRGVRSIPTGMVTNGLVLWLDASITPSYPGSGTTWTDLSGNRNNGTLTNGPTYNNSDGGSIVFDGVNDYVNAGNLGTFYPQGTISFWMNSSVVENYRNPFTTNYLGSNNGIRFEQSTGALGVVVGNAPGSYAGFFYASSNFISNTWYHIVLVWNTTSNNVTGYQNNTQKFNSSHNIWPSTLPAITIGNGFDNSRYFSGKVASLSIYNRALSAAEISQIFNAQKARFGL